MTQPAYIPNTSTSKAVFIVGVSRSGTTLMRKILNASDNIAIAPENHFLGHIVASEGMRYKFRRFGNLSNDDNVRQLVDYIYSPKFKESSRYRELSTQWRWIVKRINKDDFLQRIVKSDRSERALFMIMMQVYADHEGKPIMGEKTPAHMRYVETLLKWFPEGRVIHMLRDPRGIFTSELRRREKQALNTPYKQLKRVRALKLFIMLQTTLIWFESMYRYHTYRKRYPSNYCVVRFEDLVKDPEQQIRRLCAFLNIEFQDKMLEQVVVSKGFQAGQAGFDAHAADRWKDHIDRWINAWFLFWFRRQLKELGYLA